MSKESAYYAVIENQRRMEQARAEAWREARSLDARARALMDRVDEARQKYGRDAVELAHRPPQRPVESCGLDGIEEYLAALRAHCSAVESDLSRTVVMAETRLLLAAIAEHTADKVIPTEVFSALPPGQAQTAARLGTPAAPEGERRERHIEVMRILARLPGEFAAAERKILERLAAEILQERERGRAETLALELRLRIQRANAQAEKAARDAERAAVLRSALRGLHGDEIAAVAAELMRVERKELPLSDALVRSVEEVERAARAHMDRVYAADVMREELERLGYEVEEGFASLFVEGGEAQLRRQGSPDYRVLMDVEPGTSRMHVRLARVGRPEEPVSQQQKLRDRETEAEWCHDFAQLRQALERRMVASGVLRRVPAGSQPIEMLEGTEKARHRRHDVPLAQRRT